MSKCRSQLSYMKLNVRMNNYSSENEITMNPMVKGFREQLDSDDEQNSAVVL
jgi:hypothetical protein